ncbi:T9SS type A sorting domain-containing protein [Polaribacter sp. MSW13]|uniref:T9SS type A sorting domain-containing protein n=1 Tax=Polaribacter marinus TaxID=2916838 RepID=A0A9X1VP88_9FLAO|nr:LamG-like jellyroll fold domain-containing protein [Polaribacter marinus]MCI2229821.1 T9SS type A sorting domain-containing protein [Polaribacter marinus]
MKTKLQFTLFILFLTNLCAFAQTDYALEFNGVDQRVKYATDATLDNLNGATDYTIEVWVKPLSTDINNNVVLKRWNQFALTLYKDDTKRFYFTHYSNSGADKVFVNTIDNVIQINEWNHLVVICNSVNNSIKLYANGVDVTLANQEALPLDALAIEEDASAANFYLAYGGSATYLNANIDKVRIKNTAENIANLQTTITDADYTSDSNTVMLLNMKEGTGDVTLNEASSATGELACTATDCTDLPTWVALSATLSLEKNSSTTFKVFPNPSTDKIFIVQSNNNETIQSIEMISLLGKSVKKINSFEKNTKIEVNASKLKTGVYFIKTVTDKGTGIQKIMVQ